MPTYDKPLYSTNGVPINGVLGRPVYGDYFYEGETYTIEYSLTHNSIGVGPYYNAFTNQYETHYPFGLEIVAVPKNTVIEYNAVTYSWAGFPLYDTSPITNTGNFTLPNPQPADGIFSLRVYVAARKVSVPNEGMHVCINYTISLSVTVKDSGNNVVATEAANFTIDNEYTGADNPTPIPVKFDVATSTISFEF
jgi:hypothetical protein